MATKKIVDTRDEILDYLDEIKRPLMWIADNTTIPYGSIYSIFHQRTMELTEDRLKEINNGLGTDFKLI